jgi:hypothetical protein
MRHICHNVLRGIRHVHVFDHAACSLSPSATLSTMANQRESNPWEEWATLNISCAPTCVQFDLQQW